MKTRFLTLAVCVAATGLAACGNRGALERPGPLWGDPRDVPVQDGAPGEDDSVLDEERPEQRLPPMPGDDPFDDE
ncbi:LPS translocon maturation chaperone LptM [Glycocaulis sp.]|uniref:LPS translocon maturation chaperone LptM n=1 Tax=Glycocaulis sp. TaxID=1969725 RepID=UPI003F72B184